MKFHGMLLYNTGAALYIILNHEQPLYIIFLLNSVDFFVCTLVWLRHIGFRWQVTLYFKWSVMWPTLVCLELRCSASRWFGMQRCDTFEVKKKKGRRAIRFMIAARGNPPFLQLRIINKRGGLKILIGHSVGPYDPIVDAVVELTFRAFQGGRRAGLSHGVRWTRGERFSEKTGNKICEPPDFIAFPRPPL